MRKIYWQNMASSSNKKSYSKVFSMLKDHNKWFENSIPLIASENIPSPAVREAIISDFGNRYAEGWPGERVYAGCVYIDKVEFECMRLAKKLFKAEFADVRPVSGVVANLAVYSAFTDPGDVMLAPSIPAGGHISHGKKKAGGSIRDSKIIQGIVLDKEIVHGGMPKTIVDAKIALINTPLEISKTETDAKINITNPQQLKAFLDEENRMLKTMVDKVIGSGANVVLCQKGLDDMAQHYLTKAGVLAVRRIKESDLTKLAKATGARIVTNLDDLFEKDLGTAELVEERKIEEDRWVFIEGCKHPKSVTLLLRGGSQRVVDEVERSIHDAIMVVKDVMENPSIVAGGGAPETFAATKIRSWAKSLEGREQLAAEKFADALETIPLILAENAGMDPIDTLASLRSRQIKGEKWTGVDVMKARIVNMKSSDIIEPLLVKLQIVTAASEVACMILRIDDVVAVSKSAGPPPGAEGGMPPGMGGGMGGMPPGMGGMPDMGGMM